MITLFSGTPGSGKSCHQAENILFSLNHGKLVIANYDINLNLIKRNKKNFIYLDNERLTPSILKSLSFNFFKTHKFKEGSIQLYIDESQLLFNAREWDRSDRKGWLSFFTQHRKYGFDVFLIAQNDRMLDRQIRSLIEYEVIHRKFSNFGLFGSLLSIFFGGNCYMAVRMWYPIHEKIDSQTHHIRKKYYELYDSYKNFSEENDRNEVNAEKNEPIEKLARG